MGRTPRRIHLTSDQKLLSAKSLRNEISVISAVFNHGRRQGWITANPAENTRLPKLRKPPVRVLSTDEYSAILAHTREDFRPLVQFLAATGMRWAEATALQWRDFKPLRGDVGKANDFVFTASRGGHLHHNWFLVNVWKPALAGAGLSDVTIHDLRYFCTSVLLAEGVPMHAVSKRLGHSSFTTTVDTYSFLTNDMRVAGLESVTRIAALAPQIEA